MFSGFSEADFEAFQPARAGSNAYTLPRLKAQERCVAAARGLAEVARASGLGVELRASDAAPSLWNKHRVTAQWVFLWRDAAARQALEALLRQGRSLGETLTDPTPFYRHAFLALYLDVEAVEVTVRVHGDAWADVRNLRALVAQDGAAQALCDILASLGPSAVLGVTGGPSWAAARVDPAALRASVDALTAPDAWWHVTARIPRAEALALGADLGARLTFEFGQLLPVFRAVAWRPDNDHVSLGADLAAADASRAAQAAALAAEESAWRAQHEADIARARTEAESRAHERAAALAPARPEAVQAAVGAVVRSAAESSRTESAQPRRDARGPNAPASSQAPRGTQSQGPRGAKPGGPRPAPSKPAAAKAAALQAAAKPAPAMAAAAPTGVAVGARVKVLAGPFAGRAGVITEIDPRGVRVSFGMLGARVERGDIEALS